MVENSSKARLQFRRGTPGFRIDVVLLVALVVIAIAALAIALLFRNPSSEEIVEAFREEGLEVGETSPIEKGEGPISSRTPGTYEEGTRFVIPSLGKDSAGRDLGGRVFTFDSEEDLAEMRDFYEDLAETGFFFTWIFVEKNVLVQMNGELPEEGARKYEAVLKEVV